MTLRTVTVSIAAGLSNGAIPADATVTFELNGADVDSSTGEVVIPTKTSTTLVAGVGSVALWPNAKGTQATQWLATIEAADYRIAKHVTVPDRNCELSALLEFATVPPTAVSTATLTADLAASDGYTLVGFSGASTATPTASDTVLGLKDGVVKRRDCFLKDMK